MKKRLIIALGLCLVFAVGSLASETDNIYVKVSVKAEGTEHSNSGSGGFSVPDNEYGRITLTFYGNGQSFRLRSSGAHVGPVLHLTQQDGQVIHSGDLLMTNDIYLKPRVNENEEIVLTGYLTRMTRANEDDPPLYEFSEEKLEFILPNGGSARLKRENLPHWKSIELEISAHTDDPLIHQPRTERYMDLNGSYSLYNEDSGEFETKDCRCELGMPLSAPGNHGSCLFRNTFHLDSGDSVLLLTTYSIAGTKWHDNHSVTFDFDMARSYALNPVDADTVPSDGVLINLGEHRLAADKMIVRHFHREIRARAGEKTVIEIPSDDDNMLPFEFTERVILATTVSTKSY